MMRMSGRYGDPRRAPQSVPRELALELARERDAYAEALRRERLEVERLQGRRAEHDELARALEELRADHALMQERRDALSAQREELREERDALLAEREELRAELEGLRAQPPADDELGRLERRVEELLDDIARLRRNQARELEAGARAGARGALEGMLEVRDNMARALELLSGDGGPWEQGFAGVLGQLDAALARAGVRPFGAVGERFDPTIHEAVGLEADEGLESGSLRRVERVGFRFEEGGALLRPAQVVVAA